ncbi:MAG: hypothetical protein HOE90_20740 [Bacteriovoracaceae bacterium]|nr:hypothetical protein [Bacteriovoracaceae bacterium]
MSKTCFVKQIDEENVYIHSPTGQELQSGAGVGIGYTFNTVTIETKHLIAAYHPDALDCKKIPIPACSFNAEKSALLITDSDKIHTVKVIELSDSSSSYKEKHLMISKNDIETGVYPEDIFVIDLVGMSESTLMEVLERTVPEGIECDLSYYETIKNEETTKDPIEGARTTETEDQSSTQTESEKVEDIETTEALQTFDPNQVVTETEIPKEERTETQILEDSMASSSDVEVNDSELPKAEAGPSPTTKVPDWSELTEEQKRALIILDLLGAAAASE